jgi:IS5 family transposase
LLEANDLSLQIMATINTQLTQRGLLLKTGTVLGTSGNVHDVTQGVKKRADAKSGIQWHIAMRPE